MDRGEQLHNHRQPDPYLSALLLQASLQHKAHCKIVSSQSHRFSRFQKTAQMKHSQQKEKVCSFSNRKNTEWIPGNMQNISSAKGVRTLQSENPTKQFLLAFTELKNLNCWEFPGGLVVQTPPPPTPKRTTQTMKAKQKILNCLPSQL